MTIYSYNSREDYLKALSETTGLDLEYVRAAAEEFSTNEALEHYLLDGEPA